MRTMIIVFVCVCLCLCLCSSDQASMAAIYYEKIDAEGHHFGPDSYQLKAAVQQLDLVMQELNRKVKVSRHVTAASQSLFPVYAFINAFFVALLFNFRK